MVNGAGVKRWIVMVMIAYKVEDAKWIMERAEGTSKIRARKSFPFLVYSAFADRETRFLRFFSSFSSKAVNVFFATVSISEASSITGIGRNFCERVIHE
ncbi:MAG: hypothetical protein OEX77_12305 [Candidatus Bathyarchaeota archaeon]|nr:hypothetical protein [Candidatus Bathyarchaeota archaeon]